MQLNGFVDNENEKAQAETVAKAVSGVKGVENNLMIKQVVADGRRRDRRLVDHGEGEIGVGRQRGDQGGRHQGRDARRRRAALRLRRERSAEDAATKVAQSVEGVKAVNNGISVKN